MQRLGFFTRHVSLAAALCLSLASPGIAELYINELFLDPGGQGEDNRDEYIELRGTPGMSLENYYLIFVENENDILGRGTAGQVEGIFTLGRGAKPNGTPLYSTPYSLGSNGFLTIRMKDSLYTDIAPGTTNLVNTGVGLGFGSDAGSSVRFSDEGAQGITENSGSTIMLIRNDGNPFLNQPFLGLDLDVGNNGLDSPETSQFGWRNAWTIVDSIGYFGEAGEAGLGRTYAKVNFGPEIPGAPLDPSDGGKPDGEGGFVFVPNIEDGAVYVGLNYEVEMLARWGNSTGESPDDWHITNLTDRSVEGRYPAATGVDPNTTPATIDYRQSGGFHDALNPSSIVETNQYVPYGTALTTTIGAENFPLNTGFIAGDFSGDGVVDAADYTVWRDNLDASGLGLVSDADGSGVVDAQDYEWWRANYGSAAGKSAGVRYMNPGTTAAQLVSSVPEPASMGLIALAYVTLGFSVRRHW
jgi:hypothetical protein